jgi:ABC-type multidrug transport system fused ATPase/permease subunit
MNDQDATMSVAQTLRASLRLLSKRDRRLLLLVTLIQMATAFLDLGGILLLGIVAALSLSILAGTTPPEIVERALSLMGLGDVDPIVATGILGGAAALLLLSKSGISIYLTRRVLQFLANRQAMVSGRLASGLLSRPLLQVQRRSSQETAYALTSGASSATLIVIGQSVIAVTEATLLIVLSIGLLVVDPIVTVFTLIFFLLLAVLLHRIVAAWAGRLGRRGMNADIQSTEAVQEALRTYREVTVSNRRPLYVSRFQDLRWQAASVQSDLSFMGMLPKYIFEAGLVVGGGLLVVSQLIFKDATGAVATIAIFLVAGSRVVPSILRLQGALLTVKSASGAAKPTLDLDAELRESIENPEETSLEVPLDNEVLREMLNQNHDGFDPVVRVSGVSVTFPGSGQPALVDVSLNTTAGKSLALVGPTGAGKSTLADVILGVLVPDEGSVSVSGMTPAEAVSRWPGAIGYVPQEVAMANGSIRQNVALGLPEGAIDDDRVWEALDRAHLSEYLRSSREGLETRIGEHGIKLSGGQRQRLGMARALYTRPKLLVMDEATSALDAETEQAIVDTLVGLEGSVTTITIAHRLATIRHCDEVIYLDSGLVHARGKFEEVRSQVPNFDRQAELLGL